MVAAAEVRYCPIAGSAEEVVAASAVGAVAFEGVAPGRRVRAFRGQRNFCGQWWIATTARHVPFESWCERDHLIALDFDPDVIAVAGQPFTLRFAAGDGTDREHTPDFFVRTKSGAAVVIDVRPDGLIDAIDAEKFDVTAALCRLHGWQYRRVGELPNPWMANVRWLAGYRHDRTYVPGIADAVRAVAARRGVVPLGVLADAVGERIAVVPTMFHLMWKRELRAELANARLSFDTPVSLASAR